MKPSEVSAVDFFSGCGGTSVGFQDAGMSVAVGLDFDHDSASTFRDNFPNAGFIEKDIREVSIAEVENLLPSGPLLFSGCAPCQPFSRQNQSQSNRDPRRNLLEEFSRFVMSLTPEFVVVENVPGMQKPNKGGPLDSFVKQLRNAGYSVNVSVLRALDYGVPQERRRLVLVASKNGQAKLPEPTHGGGRLFKPATVRQYIGGLPVLADGGIDADDPDHAAMGLSELNRERIRATPEGGDRRDWDERLFLNCHKDHRGHTDVYGRMWWDRPASGLTTKCLSYSNGRFGHPVQNRAISVREAARIQTFPMDFRFSGTLTSRGRQVGNAVPPLMAKQIGEALTT